MREAGELTTMSEERSEYLNSLASGQFLVAIGFCVLQVLSQFDRHPVVVGSGRSKFLGKLTRLAKSLHRIVG